MKITGYELSRMWFDFCFENPEKINPTHTALYMFCIEHCNRLGWKEKFGLPSTMAKEAIGVHSYNTYINTLRDLIEFGFIKMIAVSKNQYSSNIIALSNFNKALDKALDKASIKHMTKQCESTIQSNYSIIKQLNIEQLNIEQITLLKNIIKKFEKTNSDKSAIKTKNLEFRKNEFKNNLEPFLEIYGKDLLNDFFLYWTEMNQGGKKMRFEMQTVFDIKRRLITWHKNSTKNNFSPTQKTTQLIADTSEVDKARRLQQEYLNSLKKHETLIN